MAIRNTFSYFVLLFFSAEPKYVNITLPDGQDVHLPPKSSVGPFNEGQDLRLLCESGGGKPIPRVTWYNGTQIMSGTFNFYLLHAGSRIYVNCGMRTSARSAALVGMSLSTSK